jgi:hypothetical protein
LKKKIEVKKLCLCFGHCIIDCRLLSPG